MTLALVIGIAPAISSSAETSPWSAEPVAVDPEVLRSLRVQRYRPIRRRLDPAAHPRAALAQPAPDVLFEGLANPTNREFPPDANGDVGPDHYVQTVNHLKDGSHFAVFDKTGAMLFQPAPISTFWAGLGGPCENHGQGDPIVQYDALAGRWLISQFAFKIKRGELVPPYYECIAITDSDDATAGGTAYTFLIDDKWFPDYPKFGVWDDAYYMSVHLFGKYDVKGQGIIAFDREAMLQGLPAREIQFFYNPAFFGALPADVSGTSAPEPGTPNFLAVLRDDNLDARNDQILLYAFLANWEAPAYSAILGPAQLEVEPFNSNLCYCIWQKGSDVPLDPIAAGFLMYPMAYRNFGDTDSLVLNHTIKVGKNKAAVRWYEISDPWTNPQIVQEGTVPRPDNNSRWMASINLDKDHNMALGYSISGRQMFPSIATNGRLATDAPGTMGQGETVIVAGQGSQQLNYRWGDYTSMQVDPDDDCTFWYTNEYYENTDDRSWNTAVAAFKYPGC